MADKEFVEHYEHWFDEDKRWTDSVKETFKDWVSPQTLEKRLAEKDEEINSLKALLKEKEERKFFLVNKVTGKFLKKNLDGSFDDLYHYSSSMYNNYADVVFTSEETKELELDGYEELDFTEETSKTNV